MADDRHRWSRRLSWAACALLLGSMLSACGKRARRAPPPRFGPAPPGTPPPQGTPGSSGPTCGHHGDVEPPPLAGITAAHNAVRCRIARPGGGALAPLAWSAPLASEAQRYADQLASRGCDLQHSQTSHGENLFAGTGRNAPAEVVARWAGEQQCFQYASFPSCCTCTCGHYTQLVWAGTSRLGCGRAACANGSEVWVCNYDPAGNFVDTMPY